MYVSLYHVVARFTIVVHTLDTQIPVASEPEEGYIVFRYAAQVMTPCQTIPPSAKPGTYGYVQSNSI